MRLTERNKIWQCSFDDDLAVSTLKQAFYSKGTSVVFKSPNNLRKSFVHPQDNEWTSACLPNAKVGRTCSTYYVHFNMSHTPTEIKILVDIW